MRGADGSAPLTNLRRRWRQSAKPIVLYVLTLILLVVTVQDYSTYVLVTGIAVAGHYDRSLWGLIGSRYGRTGRILRWGLRRVTDVCTLAFYISKVSLPYIQEALRVLSRECLSLAKTLDGWLNSRALSPAGELTESLFRTLTHPIVLLIATPNA